MVNPNYFGFSGEGACSSPHLRFTFLSNRFLGSLGFFVLETSTAKQINLHFMIALERI